MNKTYCKHCQERIMFKDGKYRQVVKTDYTNSVKCKATGTEHVPR